MTLLAIGLCCGSWREELVSARAALVCRGGGKLSDLSNGGGMKGRSDRTQLIWSFMFISGAIHKEVRVGADAVFQTSGS